MLNKLSLIIIAIFVVSNFFAQNISKKTESIKANSNMQVTEISKNIIEIKNKQTGLKIYKNISEVSKTKNILGNVDTTKIDITNINDSLYNLMYEFWFDTDVSGQSYQPAPIADIDNDGNAEMYGHIFEVNNHNRIANDFVIYEFNPTQESFNLVHTFEKHLVGGYYGGLYDINQDGNEQVCLVDLVGDSAYIQASKYYENETEGSLPTVVGFNYYDTTQCNNHTYGDFNKDGVVDLINFRTAYPVIQILQYNSAINNLELVYEYPLDGGIEYAGAGFSAEDIDGDGYPELVFGGMNGGLFVFEYQPQKSQYELVFHKEDVGTHNVYLHFSTKDIDGNGKNEFWIGGDAFYNGQGITRFTCYEATGNNQYEIVHALDIYNLFSWYAGNMFTIDIDKDGKDEIFMCVDQNILVFKFTGTINNPSYSLYYHWHNPKSNDQDWGKIYGAKMYDLDHDGFEEIIINGKAYTQPKEGYGKVESYIYKPTDVVSIKKTKKNNLDFRLFQNYPNPFNPKTLIRYKIGDTRFVSVTVYNMLGQEVATLINKEQNAGSYNVILNGDNLPSGIYLIKMTAGKYTNTIKALLIK